MRRFPYRSDRTAPRPAVGLQGQGRAGRLNIIVSEKFIKLFETESDQIHDKPKQMPQPDLRGQENKRGNKRWGTGRLVTFPVSYHYNGGVSLEDGWYPGFSVPDPIVPKGYELVGIGIGLQLNAHPPYATKLLRPIRQTGP